MANELELLKVVIDGVEFTKYSEYSMIYQRSYLKSPTRTNGVIQNLDDYDTINVPQLSFSFKYMPIEMYRQLMNMALQKNEFVVQCYDFISDQVVTENMYFEPKNMAKIQYKVQGLGTEQALAKLAVLDEKWNLVGTNSDLRQVSITFDANGGTYHPTGTELNPSFSGVYSTKGVTPPTTAYSKSGFNFYGFNTDPNGDGNFYPCNWQFTMMNNMTLYAQYRQV